METERKYLVEMGNRINRRREQLGMTQEELAELTGLSVKTVISAEKGQKALRPENIIRFSQSLDIDISYLMTGKVSNYDILSTLSSRERMAFEKIFEAFLSVCNSQDDP